MYTRITEAGGLQYLQLVVSSRNESGTVRTRVVANLGRLDQITPERIDSLINGLNRAVGRVENTASTVIQEPGSALAMSSRSTSFGGISVSTRPWARFTVDCHPAWV